MLFLERPIINLSTKRIKTELLFKLSNLNSNLALTLGYLNPALNNSALKYKCIKSRQEKKITKGAIYSTKLSGNFGPKLNGSVRSNRKSFQKTGAPFEVGGPLFPVGPVGILVEWIAPQDNKQNKTMRNIRMFGFFSYSGWLRPPTKTREGFFDGFK